MTFSRLFAIAYLLFCIVYLLTLPTTASFNDSESVRSSISAANAFGDSQLDKSSDAEEDNNYKSEKKEHKVKNKNDRQNHTNKMDKQYETSKGEQKEEKKTVHQTKKNSSDTSSKQNTQKKD